MLVWGDRVKPPVRTRLTGHTYGVYYTLCIGLFRLTVRVPHTVMPPDPVLYYMPHGDLIPGVFAARGFRHFAWVNDNTVGGYAAALPALAAGVDVFRIGRGGHRSPYEQVRDFLRERTGPVGIFTDGGRRDGRVRTSLRRWRRTRGGRSPPCASARTGPGSSRASRCPVRSVRSGSRGASRSPPQRYPRPEPSGAGRCFSTPWTH